MGGWVGELLNEFVSNETRFFLLGGWVGRKEGEKSYSTWIGGWVCGWVGSQSD